VHHLVIKEGSVFLMHGVTMKFTHIHLAAKLRMSVVIPPPTSRHLVGRDSFMVAFIRLLGADYFQLSLGLNNSKVTWNFSD